MRNPDKLFYAYTKSLRYWVKYREWTDQIENFILTASRGGRDDHLIDEHNLRESVVVFSEDEAHERNLEIDHNDSHAAVDFRAETDTLTHAFFIDGSADKIGFGTDSPADASVEINQANSSGAIACLSLDQDDTDQEFIKFDGTSNSDQSSSITTDTSVGSLTGHIRVNVNGTDYWIPFYATN